MPWSSNPRRLMNGGSFVSHKTAFSRPVAGVRDTSSSAPRASLPDQGLPKGVKPPRPPPAFVKPPTPPPSVETWQNIVLLMDKPKGWTSFDVVGRGRRGRRNKTTTI